MATIAKASRPFSLRLRPRYRASNLCSRCRAHPPPLYGGTSVQRTAGFAVSARVNIKKYTEDHEWVELSEDGSTGTIGVSTYAANQLGDVVFVELPQLEQDVKAGDSMGAVESVKSASDIISPVSGTVVAVNSKLEETPALINKSPEENGWIARVTLKDSADLDSLMDGNVYAKFTDGEK